MSTTLGLIGALSAVGILSAGYATIKTASEGKLKTAFIAVSFVALNSWIIGGIYTKYSNLADANCPKPANPFQTAPLIITPQQQADKPAPFV